MKPRTDVHQAITDRIVAQIEAGAGDFQMPWHRSSAPLHRPRNILSRRLYRGINIVSLWIAAEASGYNSATWGTFKQWQERGANVRKGEKGTMVVVYKDYQKDPDPNNPDDNGRRMFARASYVFNAAQVDGYDAGVDTPPDLGAIDKIAAAEAFIRASGAAITTGGERAFYRPSTDTITMPDERLFTGSNQVRTEKWYSVLLHELTHWTGAPHRLDRDKTCRLSKPEYAFEELIAELGAAFLCSTLGISNEPRKDHAQYIANWLQALKNDKRAIFTAASQASKAADYLETLAAAPRQIAA